MSTDDERIADITRQYGAEVIYHPPKLSEDDVPSFPVVKWDVEYLKTALGLYPPIYVILRATAPLRLSCDIENAIDLFLKHSNVDCVASVAEVRTANPVKLKRIEDGFLTDAFKSEGPYPIQRQRLEKFYIRNEALYVSNTKVIENGSLWGEKILPYVMPDVRSININPSDA